MLGLRPEDIRHCTEQSAIAVASVDLVEPTGPEDIVTLTLDGQPAVIRTPAEAITQGVPVGIDDKAMLFDPASGLRLA